MKRGFTLVEVVLTLSILVILFSLGIGGLSSFDNFKKENENENFIKEIRTVISIGKNLAGREGKIIKIGINTKLKKVYMVSGTKEIYSKKIPNNLKFNSENYEINITSRGKVNLTTWKFTDGKKTYRITKPVGGDYINVYY